MDNAVLVVGSVAFDDVETPFGKRVDSLGGSAVYFSMAASFFSKTRIVGVAGEDYPRVTIEMLKKRNIDVEGLEITKGKTFRWGGKYHEDINFRDTLYTHLNVFADFKPNIPDAYKSTPFVFLGNIQPVLQMDVLKQIQKPRFIALDTMNLWIDTARDDLIEVMRKVDLLLINDSEMTEITGELNLIKALKKLHNYGIKYIIIKKGEHGAYLSELKNKVAHIPDLFYIPAFPVLKPTDPTGAGDSFAGGIMGYLSSREEINFTELKKSLAYGAIMGSLCVEHFSIDGLTELTEEKLEIRYNKLRDLVTI